jgi:ABC-type cobalamin/Fe3+-siderophores transport system ATPase subunit
MEQTADDVLVINNGKLIATGAMQEVCQGRTLEEAFLDLTSKAIS